MESGPIGFPILCLPQELLEEITRPLELRPLLLLAVLSGNKALAYSCRLLGGVKTVRSQLRAISPALLRTIVSFRHLTHLQLGDRYNYTECMPTPAEPHWVTALPPTLVDIRLFSKGAMKSWLRVVNNQIDPRMVREIDRELGVASCSVQDCFPRLHTLWLYDTHRHLWSTATLARFLTQLPLTVTSLHLPTVTTSGDFPLPPREVLQNLVDLSLFVGDENRFVIPTADFELAIREHRGPPEKPSLEPIPLEQLIACLANLKSLWSTSNLQLATLVNTHLPPLPHLHHALQIWRSRIPTRISLPAALTAFVSDDWRDYGILFDPLPSGLTSLSIPHRLRNPDLDLSRYDSLTSLEVAFLTQNIGCGRLLLMPPRLTTITISRNVRARELAVLPPTLTRFAGNIRLTPRNKTELRTMSVWTPSSVRTCILRHYLPQLQLENFVVRIFLQHHLQCALEGVRLIDYEVETQKDRLRISTCVGRLLLPPTLTRCVTDEQVNHLCVHQLPTGLTELTLKSSSWMLPGESRRVARSMPTPALDLAIAMVDPNYMLPPNLHTLETAPRTIREASPDRIGARSDSHHFFPLLATAPLLTKLSLMLRRAEYALALANLPPTITDLTVNSNDFARRLTWPPGLGSNVSGWLPKLKHFSATMVVLTFDEWICRLSALASFNVDDVLVDRSLVAGGGLSLSRASLRRRVIDQYFPSHLRQSSSQFRL